jgi:hypothetical protein
MYRFTPREDEPIGSPGAQVSRGVFLKFVVGQTDILIWFGEDVEIGS